MPRQGAAVRVEYSREGRGVEERGVEGTAGERTGAEKGVSDRAAAAPLVHTVEQLIDGPPVV
jgi:hypothetical protein